MRCERAQQWMTAAIDGELSPRRRRALDRHLAGCESCGRELVATERMLAAVAALPMETEVPARVEQDTLRRVRVLAAAESEASRWHGWRAFRLPAFALASAMALALAVGVMRESGGPPVGMDPATPVGRVAVAPAPSAVPPAAESPEDLVASAPPAEPPGELAARPDLFVELPILRNLEKLENFDAIYTTTVEDQPTVPGGGEEQSSG